VGEKIVCCGESCPGSLSCSDDDLLEGDIGHISGCIDPFY